MYARKGRCQVDDVCLTITRISTYSVLAPETRSLPLMLKLSNLT